MMSCPLASSTSTSTSISGKCPYSAASSPGDSSSASGIYSGLPSERWEVNYEGVKGPSLIIGRGDEDDEDAKYIDRYVNVHTCFSVSSMYL
jgi:hypothetical protein